MRLRTRLVMAIAFSSLVPLGLLGWGAASVAYKQVLDKESELLDRSSGGMSLFVEAWLTAQKEQLAQQAGLLDFESLPAEAQGAYLRLLYRQFPEARIVTVVSWDPEEAPLVYPEADSDLDGRTPGLVREEIDASRHALFQSRLPVDVVKEAWSSRSDPSVVLAPYFGQPYLPPGREAPVIPAAVLLPHRDGVHVLGLELALDDLAQSVGTDEVGAPAIALLNREGAFILGEELTLIDQEATDPFLGSRSELRYVSSRDGQEVLAATHPVEGWGWTIVVASPVSVSAQTAVKIRKRTVYLAGVSGVLCLLVGVILARQLSGPVVQLKDAALAVAEGDLGRVVEPTGSNEITELTQTFNFMSQQLKGNQERIQLQQTEIEAFNAELQDRVEERTKELEEAHEQLVHSARLAAVGEMGAGLAHELNNPIAGILGMTQLMMARADDKSLSMLKSVEDQALRCKEIVGTLLGFSKDLSTENLSRMDASSESIDLAELISEVLVLVSAPLAQRGVEVESELEEGLTIDARRAELGQAMAQLFTSMCSVVPRGGNLRIRGQGDKGSIELWFNLEGPEIRFGSDDWKASGLGFWAARRVLASHKGQLERVAAAEDGPTATWLIRFEQS